MKFLYKHRKNIVKYGIIIFLLLLDVIFKLLAKKYLIGKEEISFIPKIINFLYVENKGAAFGIMENARVFLILFTIIFLTVFIWFDFKLSSKSKAYHLGYVLIISGAVGNLIDRVFLGYVTDYLKFDFMEFAIFNFADMLLCFGLICYVVYLVSSSIKEAKENKKLK